MNFDFKLKPINLLDLYKSNTRQKTKAPKYYNPNANGKDSNIFHRKNDIQYSSFRSGPIDCCFSFVAQTLKSFSDKGFDNVQSKLEQARDNKQSEFIKDVKKTNVKYKSLLNTSAGPQVIESKLYKELGFKSLPSKTFVTANNIPVRNKLAFELTNLNPGYYSIGLESNQTGHELGFVKKDNGTSYLIDSNRGIRFYNTDGDLTQDLGKIYPANHKKHFAGKEKFKYFTDLNFFRFTITQRIPTE